jgi:integrase
MAEVLLGTGMRLGELVALEWRDIDWDAGAIRVERAYERGLIGTPKGDRGRTIQIDSVVLARLRDHRQKQFAPGRRASGIIFATSVGARMLPNNVRDRGHLTTLAQRRPATRPPPRSTTYRRNDLARERRIGLLRPAAARARGPENDHRDVRPS